MPSQLFKFIHAADIHLDSPLRGLERYEGAPVDALRHATREALANLVQLALDEEVSFVIIAGDLYDGEWKDYHTGLYLVSQLVRLRDAGISVYILKGNHDADSEITRHLKLPDNVHTFDHKRPQTFIDQATGAALHGQSFANKAELSDLSAGYPPPEPGRLNIGVLHTAIDGREGHMPYAPCSLPALLNHGYDYWALGHVHNRDVLSEAPWVVFPGNLQGRKINETGAKGCTLVTVEDGAIASAVHRDVDVLRWAKVQVDLSGTDDPESALRLISRRLSDEVSAAHPRLVAARVRLVGATSLHGSLNTQPDRWVNDLRAVALEVGSLWIEKVKLRTRPPMDLEALAGRDDPLGSLLRGFASEPEGGVLRELSDELDDLLKRLPHELKPEVEGLLKPGGAALQELWRGARDLIVARLATGEDQQ